MTDEPSAVIAGTPGAGAAAAAEELRRAGVGAVHWEGVGSPPLDLERLDEPGRPHLIWVAAAAEAAMERWVPPWAEPPMPASPLDAARLLRGCSERLFPLHLRAELVLDTSHLDQPLLRARLRQLVVPWLSGSVRGPVVVLESFAFPRGVPLDLQWCLDVRALRNPHWEPRLRLRSGLDPEVAQYVLDQPLAQDLVGATEGIVARLLGELRTRARPALRLAVGCTGGYHRSVAVVEALGRRLGAEGPPALLWHRDLPSRL